MELMKVKQQKKNKQERKISAVLRKMPFLNGSTEH